MTASPFTRRQALACAVLMWAGIYLPALGSLEIKGEEGRRLLPAVAMLQTGRWIVPQIGGEDYLSKPPLINWLAAAAFRAAGDPRNEWAARAPSVLAVLALALTTVWALADWLGAGGAMLAAVFMLTNIGLMEKGRLAEIEALYLSLTGVALVTWLGGWRRDAGRVGRVAVGGAEAAGDDGNEGNAGRAAAVSWRTWTLPWVFLGLGLLTKGPLHLVFFYAVVVAVLGFAGRLRDLWNVPHLVGVVLMLAIFGAWAVPYFQQTAADRVGGVWLAQFQGRLEVNEGFHFASWLLNVPRGLVNFLPWVVLLPLAWRRGGRPGTAGEGAGADAGETPAASTFYLLPSAFLDRAVARGLGWAVGGCFLAVSFAPGGQPRYTLPLLVPASVRLALVLARGAGRNGQGDDVNWPLPPWLTLVWGRVVMAGVLLAMAAVPVAVAFGGRGTWHVAAALAVLAAGAFLWKWLLDRQADDRPGRVFTLGLASAAVIVMLTVDYAFGAVHRLRKSESVRPAAAAINHPLAAGGERTAVLRAGFLPFLFYLREPPLYVQNADALPVSVHYLLIRQEDEPTATAALRRRGMDWRIAARVNDKRAREPGRKEWLLLRLERPPEARL